MRINRPVRRILDDPVGRDVAEQQVPIRVPHRTLSELKITDELLGLLFRDDLVES